MRVYDQNLTGPQVNEAGKAQETQRTTGTGAARSNRGGGGEDRVEFSSALGTLSRTIAADSANRAERVDALAAEFAVGKYHPNAQATGHGILSEALAQGGR